MKKLIAQGAEAKIFLDLLPEPTIHKERISKGYRHPQLDKQIRKRRTKSEAKILIKAAAFGVNVPKVKTQDLVEQTLIIEYIEGDRLSETLNDYEEKKQFHCMNRNHNIATYLSNVRKT